MPGNRTTRQESSLPRKKVFGVQSLSFDIDDNLNVTTGSGRTIKTQISPKSKTLLTKASPPLVLDGGFSAQGTGWTVLEGGDSASIDSNRKLLEGGNK